MNKSNKQLMYGIGAVLVVAFLFFYLKDNTSPKPLALLGRTIYIPQYWVGECSPRVDNLAEVEIKSHTNSPTFYHCTTADAGKWIPQVNGVQCTYIITGFSTATIRNCEGVVNKLDNSKCSGDLTSTFGDKQFFTVNAGDTLYIDTNSLFGTAKLVAKHPSYGIKIHQADGLITATSTNCLLNTINANDKGVIDLHTIGQKDRVEVLPDNPFNVVSGLRPAISSQAVSLNDVENGFSIYITRPGFYNLIKKADDGFEYVDTRQEFRSDRIECIPRTSGCNDEARIVKIEQQSCDKFGGKIVGYAPVQGDSTKLCKYACMNGVLKVQNDCIEIPKSCPSDKPLFDSQTGRCVTLSEQTLVKPVCSSCFGWLRNKISGNKSCVSQPAKRVLGFIPIPLTSQNSICPIFILILLIVLGGGGFWAYIKFGRKRRKK